MGQRILLIEDEKGLVMTMTDRLQREGYAVDSCGDGESGYNQACAQPYDLILLDVMMPKRSGFDVCRDLRQKGIETPILMLTARDQTVDKVVGLKLGADDYVTKPFDMMELLARVEALLRRSPAKPDPAAGSFEFGEVKADFRAAEVTRDGTQVALSAKEFQLLRFLVENKGEAHSREKLLSEVWGYEAAMNTRTVDVHMAWLRQKLEQNPKFPRHLVTVRGIGYKFVD
ncbi:MAG: response regulator transcription factor [Acidimicrobiia bacterium]|nr:response regulator transcription factor [Acidimicrobiia bacterium]